MTDFQLRSQVMTLRKLGYTVNDIAHQLGLHTSTERESISRICQEKELRRYQRGIDFAAPAYRRAGSNG